MESDNALEVVINAPEVELSALDNLIAEGEADRRLGKQKIAVGLGLLKNTGIVGGTPEFNAYCLKRHGYETSYTYVMVRAGMVFVNLSTIVDRGKWPESISQADVLAKLTPADQCKLWAKLDEEGELQGLSAAKLKCYVQEVIDFNVLEDRGIVGVIEQGSADKMTVKNGAEPCHGEQETGEDELLPPEMIDDNVVEFDDSAAPYRDKLNNAVASPQSSCPPWGMDAVQRERIMATGLNFVKLGVHGDGRGYVMQWCENLAGWQELLPMGEGVERFWKKLLDNKKVIECY